MTSGNVPLVRGARARARTILLLALIASSAVCGSVASWAAERTWVLVTSPNFTVVSDAGDKSASRTAWQFEQVRAVLQRLWPWARIATGKPVVIFAARDENTMKSLMPKFREVKGGVRPASVFVGGPDRHYIAVRTDVAEPDSLGANPYFPSYWSFVYITLESSFGRELPMWLGRGLSDVFANTIVREKDIQLGRVVPWHLQTLREGARVRLPVVLAADRASRHATGDQDARDFDASAWALVHYLGFGESGANLPKLNQFLELVSKGRDVNTSLVEVYGPLDRLDETVHAYVGRTLYTYKLLGLDVNVTVDGFTKRTLSAAESTADRAMLHAVTQRPAEARQLAKAAAAADPTLPVPAEVEGMLGDLEGQKDAALAAYSRAAELQSTNFYSYYRRAQLRWQPTLDRPSLERIAGDLEKTITLNSTWAPGYSYLADVCVDLDDAERALGLARRAVALEPGAPYHRLATARALARLSRQGEAIQEAERALALARTPEDRQRAEQLIAYLKQSPK
jgi:hypothetical protein